jgi:FkbM family methyltransferase
MSLKTILLALFLKWLYMRRRFIKLLPLPVKKKLRMLDSLKLRQLTVRSNLQSGAVKEMFGAFCSGVMFNTENGILINNTNDVQVSASLGNLGGYNKKELDVLMSLVRATDMVYILGAHIGALLVPIAKKVKNVVGFEANPVTYELLKINVAANNLENTDVYNYAIYNSETTLSFYQNKANSGGSKIKPINNDHKYNYDNPAVIEVKAYALDTIVKEISVPLPNFIIMDIEGAEYFALQGGAECLKHAAVMYIEFVPHHLKNISNVNISQFCSLLTKYFDVMKLIEEEINNESILYRDNEINDRLSLLYSQDKSADILLYKNAFFETTEWRLS